MVVEIKFNEQVDKPKEIDRTEYEDYINFKGLLKEVWQGADDIIGS